MCNFPEYNKISCVGCGSCALICPQNCIKMFPDQEGFLYPELDATQCISCGLCRTHCPITNEVCNTEPLYCYGFIHKDEDVLMDSSSGGAFTAFAEYVLENRGHIYGTSFNEKTEAKTVVIKNSGELQLLRGSKYVQSDTNGQYENIKADLESDIIVLYCSTPCQVAGLKAYLNKDYSNLLTLDLFCHGTPSPLLFKKYIEWLTRNQKGNISSYKFRKKEFGWGTQGSYNISMTERKIISTYDPYYYSFLVGKTYRISCYECKYASPQRAGDISIGDFWGIEKTHPEVPTNKGVSAILINNEKGAQIFNRIKESGFVFQTNFYDIANNNSQLLHPVKKAPQRDCIYKSLNAMSFDRLAKKFLFYEHPAITRIRPFVPKMLKRIIKKLIKG
jgi:coenzyme F420-reducing hydrogenase beta subunit